MKEADCVTDLVEHCGEQVFPVTVWIQELVGNRYHYFDELTLPIILGRRNTFVRIGASIDASELDYYFRTVLASRCVEFPIAIGCVFPLPGRLGGGVGYSATRRIPNDPYV
jgi:hypothetical protein